MRHDRDGVVKPGHRLCDTCESVALRLWTVFCARYRDLVTHSPLGLFPPKREDDSAWLLRFLAAPHVIAAVPVDACFMLTRCMNVYHHLQTLLTQAMSNLTQLMEEAHARDRFACRSSRLELRSLSNSSSNWGSRSRNSRST